MQPNNPISQDNSTSLGSSDSAAEVIIEVSQLTKQYSAGQQKIQALDGVSLRVRQGEFIALTGASGSGKSTLLHLMGGLDKPSSGTVLVDGVNLAAISDKQLSNFRNKTIGFVFQSFYLQPLLNVARNIELAAMPNRTKRRERRHIATTLAEQVGLSDRLNNRPSELSGGQIQRVAIARALVNRPRIILADEPTGNLDTNSAREIIKLFRQVNQTHNTTVIIATHDQSIANGADRVIAMKDGAIV